jgi:hypothetical protein
MAASAFKIYNEAKKYLASGALNLSTAALRWKVVKGTSAAAVSNFTRSTFASCGTGVLGNPVTKSVTSRTFTQINGSQTIMFDAADPVFTASAGNVTSLRFIVIGVSGGLALGWTKLSADTTVTLTNTLTLQLPATGIFVLSGGTT